MLYRLSRFVPVFMRSTYRVPTDRQEGFGLLAYVPIEQEPPRGPWMHSTWWQWRGRVFRHVVREVL